MEKREVLNRMIAEGLIPVIRVTSAQEAIDVADAIKEGGVTFIEITMSVQGAIDVIKDLTKKYKDEIVMGGRNGPRSGDRQSGAPCRGTVHCQSHTEPRPHSPRAPV